MATNSSQENKRWVIKIGSALLTGGGRGIDQIAIANWIEQCVALKHKGIDTLLVSSGTIAEGMRRLGLKSRPESLLELQALASIGQMGLAQVYETCFAHHGLHTAQVLLTHDDVANRLRYLNARATLRTLLRYGVFPVVNENDTVSTEEIRFGDNDTLAGLVANLIDAQRLIIMTDQPGLLDFDPKVNPDAKLVQQGVAGDPELLTMASSSSGVFGRGGMVTKLKGAELAARSGTATHILDGRVENVLLKLADNERIGTLLLPKTAPINARKQWLAGQLHVRGELELDNGATRVIHESGKSLLAVGVKRVSGEFDRGALVKCVDAQQIEIARGLINYSASETRKIMGAPSDSIKKILGFMVEPELIHRDNLVVIK